MHRLLSHTNNRKHRLYVRVPLAILSSPKKNPNQRIKGKKNFHSLIEMPEKTWLQSDDSPLWCMLLYLP